jgi:hypothetical protein
MNSRLSVQKKRFVRYSFYVSGSLVDSFWCEGLGCEEEGVRRGRGATSSCTCRMGSSAWGATATYRFRSDTYVLRLRMIIN